MLKQILENFKDNWNEIYKQLEELREKLKKKEEDLSYGLSKAKRPYLNLFAKELFGKVEDLNEDEIELVLRLTKDIYEVVQRETSVSNYGETKVTRLRFEKELQDVLLENFNNIDKIMNNDDKLILQIVEIAEANRRKNAL